MRMRIRNTSVAVLWLTLVLAATTGCKAAAQPGGGGETIIMVRHGEKPPDGLGQLSCKGLNRSLKLPAVLLRYGKPDAIFAPDPADRVSDGEMGDKGMYSYVRPLATIEPLAIRLGMPVNTQIGYKQIHELQTALTQPKFAHGLVVVAWEHWYLYQFARQMMLSYGQDPNAVPEWPGSDYDSIYVFHLTQAGGKPHLTFKIDHEGLNGSLSDTCPK